MDCHGLPDLEETQTSVSLNVIAECHLLGNYLDRAPNLCVCSISPQPWLFWPH